MCDSHIIQDKKLVNPMDIDNGLHSFAYQRRNGEVVTLLENIPLKGGIDYAAVLEIKEMYGVKRGYLFVIGECLE